ncbi:MAG: type II toxin-antitoxin system HicB family antitoxin [Candidatus Pacebacteria bacterium]|nr:type II toxin-antitoxin system HicB family antitoxin [Candidatus Paceibacterota bacterium]MCF7862624.1 type II toxin-antitoxin system HicB family antitoxin [Candidatus Paceibacterota bacterium]
MFDLSQYKIEYKTDKETSQVIATIPALNHISSFGDSFSEAEKNIKEAGLAYLEAIKKKNIAHLQKDQKYLKVLSSKFS